MGDFSQRLKEIRNGMGVKQKEIADVLGISVRAYQHYETGTRFPDFQGITKLSEFFNVSTDYLLCKSDYPYLGGMGGGETETFTEDQQNLFSIIAHLDDDDVRILLGIAERISMGSPKPPPGDPPGQP